MAALWVVGLDLILAKAIEEGSLEGTWILPLKNGLFVLASAIAGWVLLKRSSRRGEASPERVVDERFVGLTREASPDSVAEADRAESEERYRRVFASSQDAMAVCSSDGSILDLNPAFERLSGYGKEELVGRNFQALTPRRWKEIEYRILVDQVAARGCTELYEKEIRCKDGEMESVNARVSQMEGGVGGEPELLMVLRNNGSERKQMAELRRATEAAEAVRETQNRFLAQAGHELRTPLNPIIGYADLLLAETQAPMHREFLTIIRDSAVGMSGLIGDLIEYARIESGGGELEQTSFRITDLLNSVVVELESMAQRNGNRLVACYEWNDCVVTGDKEKLRHALINLSSTACRVARHSSISLRCSHLIGEGARAVFRFEVERSWIGPATALGAGASRPTAPLEGPEGLGVAIAEKLVQAIGGTVQRVTSSGGEPVLQADVPLPVENLQADSVKNESLKPDPFESHGGAEVLVVEDDMANLRFAQDMLAHFGCRVTTAANGREGLERLRTQRFDLVLMDVSMPVMDGFEATERLRLETGANRGVPVIAMTANATRSAEANCRRSGMNDVVTKPVNIATFEEMLRKWLRSDRRQEN